MRLMCMHLRAQQPPAGAGTRYRSEGALEAGIIEAFTS
jgi:hypothetical protein